MRVLNGVLGIIQFIMITWILYREVMKKTPAMFLWATVFLMFGLTHLLTVLVGDPSYPEIVYCQASMFVILFCFLYLLFRRRKPCSFSMLSFRNRLLEESMAHSAFEWLCMFLFIASLMTMMIDTARGTGGLLNASWTSVREIERDFISVYGLASRLFFAFSGMGLYFFLTRRKLTAALVFFLIVFYALIRKSRSDLIPLFIFFITLVLLPMRRVKPKHFILGAFMAAVAVYAVYALRAFRWLGTTAEALRTVTWKYINESVVSFLVENNGELGLKKYFYLFIDRQNDFDGFNRGASYIRMLLVFIPSRLCFGMKPESFDLTMGRAIGMALGGSMHPTLFGDCFGNLNWFGILLGAFWAWMANLFDRLIDRQKYSLYKILFFFVISTSFVLIGRGSVYNGFQLSAWGILLLTLLRLAGQSLTHIRFRHSAASQNMGGSRISRVD